MTACSHHYIGVHIHSLAMYDLFPMRSPHSYKKCTARQITINHHQCYIRGQKADIDLPLRGKWSYEDASCVLDARYGIGSMFDVQDKMFWSVVVREFQRGIYVGHLYDDTSGNRFTNDVHTLQCACLNIHL